MKSASLNHVYRLVWSKVNQAWVAVAEFTSAHGKSSAAARSEAVDHSQKAVDNALLTLSFKTTTKVKLAILASVQFLLVNQAHAFPVGPQVEYGSNTFSQSGSTMTINQHTQQSVVNWQSFSIASSEIVNVLQPGGGSALYRVIGNDSSQIFGQLNATGKLFLINPNGVLFGQGSQVDVGSLLVSTHNISTSDYLNNTFNFTSLANSNGSIVNQGVIKAGNEGYVVLLANQIENTGTITANNGSVVLGASQSATLDFYGNGLVKARLSGDAVNAAINQAGTISANGGFVQLATNARSAAINMSGVIEANSLVERDGVIRLEGGAGSTVTVSGQLVAKGVDTKGGSIQVTGEQVALLNTASLDASGTTGGGEVLVGGDFQGNNADVYNARTTSVAQGASIKADATDNGDAGKVIVWSNDTTQFYGDISAQGGQQGGNGGFVEVSGKEDLYFNGSIDTSAANGVGGDVLLDPNNIIIGAKPNNASYTNDNTVDYADGSGNSTFYIDASSNTIKSNNTTLQANNDITVNAAITMNSDKSITLQAHNDITVNADIKTDRAVNGSGGNITIQADSDNSGAGTLALAANLTSGGGDITLSGNTIQNGAGHYQINSSGNAGGESAGAITISAKQNVSLANTDLVANGATGATGATGTAGTAGSTGSIGGVGSAGTAGTAGQNGSDGTNGANGTGSNGNTRDGKDGTDGGNGLAGSAGNAGVQGEQGGTGTDGDQGGQGVAGGTGGNGGQISVSSTNGSIALGNIEAKGGQGGTGGTGGVGGNGGQGGQGGAGGVGGQGGTGGQGGNGG